MKRSFLEYYKIVLDKVSFDSGLFVKEYHKACRMLKLNEVKALRKWLNTQGHSHHLEQEGQVGKEEGHVVPMPPNRPVQNRASSENDLPKAS